VIEMPNGSPSSKWVDIISTGPVVIICGIAAIASLFQNLVNTCIAGIVGIIIGIATLRMQVEKLDKIFAMMGIILSLVPMIYAIVVLV
jgi:hypothetical protein